MLTELGHLALIIALLVAMIQVLGLFVGYAKNWLNLLAAGPFLSTVQFGLIAFSFLVLTIGFLSSDFSISLVTFNSHTLKPILYKISGVWGNHEGSMLLWVLVLSLFGYLVASFGTQLPIRFKALVQAIQSLIAFSFLSFILLTSNPFNRLEAVPFNGQDLNPILQDPGLAFHPPMLYLGYVGLSITFSFAIAGLIYGNIGSAWARWSRPWTLVSWIFLTLGIALGSWWAYYELGWGGWWFWDPVENASFMPWLITTALLHSTLVLEKRDCFSRWVIFLAILAFSFSLIGTFLVRSGIITSVHAFASDPTRGIYILIILLLFSGGGFLVYYFMGQRADRSNLFEIISKEMALLANNLLLTTATLVVLIGTFWPLIVEVLFNETISVGPPYFDLAFTPFFIVLSLFVPLGIFLNWKKGSLKKVSQQLNFPIIFALLMGLIVFIWQDGSGLIAPIGLALSTWLIIGSLWEIGMRVGLSKHEYSVSLRWLLRLPMSEFGKTSGHIGLGFLILGVAAVTAWEQEDIRLVELGGTYKVGAYEFKLNGISEVEGQNYLALQADIGAFRGTRKITDLTPQKRFYPVARTTTTEAAIDSGIFRDLYVVLGDQNNDNRWVLRTYIKPMVNWIWIGAIFMALGGLLSLIGIRSRKMSTSSIGTVNQ